MFNNNELCKYVTTFLTLERFHVDNPNRVYNHSKHEYHQVDNLTLQISLHSSNHWTYDIFIHQLGPTSFFKSYCYLKIHFKKYMICPE